MSGQLQLIGNGSFQEASPSAQQIAVAFSWAFADKPAGFFVSIDPLPGNPEGPWMKVRIHPEAQDTELGWVLFESDRRLKSYSLGADTVTRLPIRSFIPGFQDGLEIALDSPNAEQNREVWSRFWLYPKETRWTTTGRSMRIHAATVGVRTETMRWEGGELVAASDSKDPDAERFAAFITERFGELANEEPVFRQLEQMLRLLLISEWIRQENIPLSLTWLNEQADIPYRLPRITPSLHVDATTTEVVGQIVHTTTLRLFGGVDFREIHPIDVSAHTDLETWTSAAYDAGRKTDREVFRFAWNGESYQGWILPAGGSKRSIRSTFPLVEAPLPGNQTFQLLGWAPPDRRRRTSQPPHQVLVPALPSLYSFNPLGRDGKEKQVGIEGVPESVVSVRHYELAGADGSLIGRFQDHEIERATGKMVVLPKQPDNPWRLYPQKDGLVWARHPEQHAFAFDRFGKLIGEQRKGLLIFYAYTRHGVLDRITVNEEGGPGDSSGTVDLIQFVHGSNRHRLLAARTPEGRIVPLAPRPGRDLLDETFTAYAEGGERAKVTVNASTGNWRFDKPIGGLDYLDRHGLEIARWLSSPDSLPRLIPDGAFTLLVTPSTVRPLPAAIHRPHQLEAAVRSTLPEDGAMLTFIKTADERTAIIRHDHNQGDYELEIMSHGMPTERMRGTRALEAIAEIERDVVRRASDSRIEFLAVAQEGEQVFLQLGDRQIRAPTGAIQRLQENPYSDENTLDKFFDQGARDLVVYRGASSRRPPGQPPSIGFESGRGGTDPVRLAAVLQERYGKKRRVYLDDETQTARYNLERLVPLQGPQDLMALVPEESFQVEDYHLARNLKNKLESGGVRMLDNLRTPEAIPNVLLISGHNDGELRRYLHHLGENGFLEGRVILLHTCYADSNADLFHDLIKLYGPKAILHHGALIPLPAVQEVTVEMIRILNQLGPAGEKIHPADLLDRATERVLAREDLSQDLERAVKRLRKAVFQISALSAPLRRNESGRDLHVEDTHA